ncbi:MAG: VanZ family protein [Bacteroidota bacterium]
MTRPDQTPPEAGRRTVLGWGAIAAALALTVLASSPLWPGTGDLLEAVPGKDKTGHFLVMGALAAACVLAFTGRSLRGWRLTPGRLLVLVAMAVTVDEVIQALVPARTFDLADLAASLAGVVLIGGMAAWSSRARGVAETPTPRRTGSGHEEGEADGISLPL